MRRETYFERLSFCDEQIATPPHADLGIAIVIPCFNEPDLIGSLESLWNCERPGRAVEVIVVINSPIGCDAPIRSQNEKTYQAACDWAGRHGEPLFTCHILHFPNLPRKHAGVGLARKIGMDEAARRFDVLGKHDGIIVGYDADCRCDANYLCAIERHFQGHPRRPGCSIYFEHPLEGPLEPKAYEAIAGYELHLRYYIQGLRYVGFPHAHHTLGSCMAVRGEVYKKQGGMNKRQAGEDFYFLQKIIPLGEFADLSETRVIPSPRPSDRVPFGTGKAVLTFLSQPKSMTYPLEAFLDLKAFFERIPVFYSGACKPNAKGLRGLSEEIRTFLEKQGFAKSLEEVRKNTANEINFRNRFFRWFNTFMVMKFMNHARDHSYGEREVGGEAAKLWPLLRGAGPAPSGVSLPDLLKEYRDLDRGGGIPDGARNQQEKWARETAGGQTLVPRDTHLTREH